MVLKQDKGTFEFQRVDDLIVDAVGKTVSKSVRYDLFGEYFGHGMITIGSVKRAIIKKERQLENLQTLLGACQKEEEEKQAKEAQERLNKVTRSISELSDEQLNQLEQALNAAKQQRAKAEQFQST